VGLSRCIGEFFQNLEHSFHNMGREAERANKVLTAIYQRPEHREAGESLLEGHLFRVRPYEYKLRQLRQQARQFRLSLDTLFASKSKVIERFMQSLVREVRALRQSLEDEVTAWTEEALAPLLHHNLYQKQLLERHMMRLASLNNESRGLDAQLKELRESLSLQEQALGALGTILRQINSSAPGGPGGSPNVVSFEERRNAKYASV